MGVMECNRRGCDNIMCNHYNSETGYICYECLTELENLQKLKPNMKLKHIKKFMETPLKKRIENVEEIKPRIDLNEFFS